MTCGFAAEVDTRVVEADVSFSTPQRRLGRRCANPVKRLSWAPTETIGINPVSGKTHLCDRVVTESGCRWTHDTAPLGSVRRAVARIGADGMYGFFGLDVFWPSAISRR
jgi:hypothetical protein